jgi:hypothetical protein
MAEIDGVVGLAHGANPEEAVAQKNELWSAQRTFLDNDQNSTPHFYCWPNGPVQTSQGMRWGRVPKYRPSGYNKEATHNLVEPDLRESESGRALVHIDSGQLPYIVSIPNTTASLDSDGSKNQLFLKFKRINVNTGKGLGNYIVNAVGDRNNNTNDGGIEDDPSLKAGQRNIAYAFDRVPQNQGLIQVDHVQIDLDTAA